MYHLVPRREARPVTRPVVHDFHLPPSGGVGLSSPVGSYSPSERASAPAKRICDKTRQTRPWRRTARPLAVQRLAAGLVAITHGLDRAHIGAICDALTATGIDPDVATQLFTPFFTTKAEGMGLGLSLCRTVVEQHGGQLGFEAHAPRGTVFRFTLPAAGDSTAAYTA